MPAYSGNNHDASNSSTGYSGIHEHSGPLHSFLEHASLLIFPVIFIINLQWASSRLYRLELLWLVALAIPLGIIGGDLVSGIVHWAADTYGSEDTPLIGPSLVKPFRLHHVYPRDICTHGLVELTGNVCILAVPLLAACLFLMWDQAGSRARRFLAVSFCVIAGGKLGR